MNKDQFAQWLVAHNACERAVRCVARRSGKECFVALQPTTEHITWALWVAVRIGLTPDEWCFLQAKLLALVLPAGEAKAVVERVIDALNATPFDAEELRAARAAAAEWAVRASASAELAAAAAAEWAAEAAGAEPYEFRAAQLEIIKTALSRYIGTEDVVQ